MVRLSVARRLSRPGLSMWLALYAGGIATAQTLPRGQIVDDVQCADDETQHYSLYLPSTFTPARKWPVILAFDAGGRGRRGVERYQAGAERYGYIVVGSSNSRNGPWKRSLDAAKAMTADVIGRFPVDLTRVYTAGMSGGARVALMVALHPDLIASRLRLEIAGVLASSAGFPPGEFREVVGFPIFGSAGTEDFNHREMTNLDRVLKSPHRVMVFEGGHEWLPVDVATEAIEWLEIQAMAHGVRPRDHRLVDQLFTLRTARADRSTSALERMRELQSIANDFHGLKNVSDLTRRAAALSQQPEVKAALEAERAEDVREDEITAEMSVLMEEVDVPSGLAKLKGRVSELLEQSRADTDSSARRIARRVLTSLRAAGAGTKAPELQALLERVPRTVR